MPKFVEDEFSNLPVSRQRRYQLRKQARGLCVICTNAANPGKSLCEHHRQIQAMKHREERDGERAAEQIRTIDLRPGSEFV